MEGRREPIFMRQEHGVDVMAAWGGGGGGDWAAGGARYCTVRTSAGRWWFPQTAEVVLKGPPSGRGRATRRISR